MKKRIILLHIISITFVFLSAQITPQKFIDGPYIFYLENGISVKYYNNGKTISNIYKFNGEQEVTFNGLLNDKNCTYSIPQNISDNPNDLIGKHEKIFVCSDIHGQSKIFVELLKNSGIIDENRNWIFGNGILIIDGDIFDRGVGVTEILWLIIGLEKQAQSFGGEVRVLLGNHEIMVLQNDMRYLDEKYNLIAKTFELEPKNLYDINTFFGKWLRSKNTLLKIDKLLFVHAGISTKIVEQNLSINEINNLVKNNIELDRKSIKTNETLNLIFGSFGLFWYRGYFYKTKRYPKITIQELETILTQFDVEKIIVGHTTQKNILTIFDGKIIAVDSGLKYGDKGEGLLIENNDFTIFDLKGKKKSLFNNEK